MKNNPHSQIRQMVNISLKAMMLFSLLLMMKTGYAQQAMPVNSETGELALAEAKQSYVLIKRLYQLNPQDESLSKALRMFSLVYNSENQSSVSAAELEQMRNALQSKFEEVKQIDDLMKTEGVTYEEAKLQAEQMLKQNDTLQPTENIKSYPVGSRADQ